MEEVKYELSEFKAAWQAKCPRCRIGHVYQGPAYGLKVQKMNTHCDYCGLRYEREPGYFYGAMYVTYAFSIAEMVTACMATYILTGNDSSFILYATVAIMSVVLMSPFNYRYSRIVLMYWLTPGLRYDPNVKKRKLMRRLQHNVHYPYLYPDEGYHLFGQQRNNSNFG